MHVLPVVQTLTVQAPGVPQTVISGLMQPVSASAAANARMRVMGAEARLYSRRQRGTHDLP